MTIKEFFQNLGQGISQGWTNLKNRFSSTNNEEANPLFEASLDLSVSDESFEKPNPSSTATMSSALMAESRTSNAQSVSDFDTNQEGIVEFQPTLSERVGRGASKIWGSVTSLFKRDDGSRLMCDWMDGDRAASYSGLDDNVVDSDDDLSLRPGSF